MMGWPSEQHDPPSEEMVDRREALKRIGWLGTALALGGSFGLLEQASAAGDRDGRESEQAPIPTRPLGRTGVHVSILGLGGGHLLNKSVEDGTRIVQEAVEMGVTFMDNAWDYYNNRSEETMGRALKGRRDRVFLMTKMCTHGRGKKTGLLHLEQSLRRLGTDYLDLWQIHEVGCADEPARLFGPDGAAEALLEAKRQGKVRFIGFTGHTDPAVHFQVLQERFPFDTCQLPLNVFDAGFKSFERLVLPELTRQGIAPIAMKSLCGNGKPIADGLISVEEAIRYTLSLPVATLVSGIDTMEVLRHNVGIVRRFVPMTMAEMQGLRTRVASYAGDGRFETYKTKALWSCEAGAADKRFQKLERT